MLSKNFNRIHSLNTRAHERHTAAPPPVRSQVDTADAQVVATTNKTGLQFQGSPVGCHRLLWAAAVSKRGAQLVPQQVVLQEYARSKARSDPTSQTRSFTSDGSSWDFETMSPFIIFLVWPAAWRREPHWSSPPPCRTLRWGWRERPDHTAAEGPPGWGQSWPLAGRGSGHR